MDNYILRRDYAWRGCMEIYTPEQGGGGRTKNWTFTGSERSWITMYSQDKINIALQVYHQCGSVTNTIRVLGYPTRRALYTWIENEGVQKTPRKVLDNTKPQRIPVTLPSKSKWMRSTVALSLEKV